MRVYTTELDPNFDKDVIPIDSFYSGSIDGLYSDKNGVGYWCKDGYKSKDKVFLTSTSDATHVSWFNK
jgi:hypothetical protein